MSDPWERTGWLMWAPWMIFLAFPVLSSLEETSTTRVVGGLVATGVFAVVYVLGATLGQAMSGGEAGAARRGAAFLAVLTAVTLGAAAAIGLEALSFTPFLVSFGTFALARPACW